jgi:NAD(P)-dependent dehydrogenase (short-subunit alcohol dehydrogenase family)
VIIGARSRVKADEAIKKIRAMDPSAAVEYVPLDLADRCSIDSFASAVNSCGAVDYLVNNAGVMGIPRRRLSKEGAEMQWAVNHLGHFYLTHLLWSQISRSSFFRVVTTSSRAHIWYLGFLKTIGLDFGNLNFDHDYDPNLSYSRSKLYNVLFTRALATKIDPKKGCVVSVNPGVVRTDIIREMTGDGIKGKVLALLLRAVWPVFCLFTKSPRQGATTALYALLADNISNGHYYSDCVSSPENPCVSQDNWAQLWTISEQYLKLCFDP